ncbi:glycerate kinase [Schleiferilactobacillus harbinensis]|uniref:Glycerate kinase n=1 Tax=Schleiferilactobacillus harbinensis DSM 16991 TaxID=1122147 RepID=A0A0R1XDR2_9LACO|nr:glycerate kinase [Schleiferilactobacillus harbinensis]KRM28303.1 glycerate kinase [Schleiferilactobacillus harbinensis DSM 16991]MBO3090735.1 glycerate kinase [Schleiferilactobacillus harbinensis]QFR64916.1 glycerate kinase [Schleiferilactobacillus harbinensis]HAY52969.1 glycerate kinase [Lactobacillus sp.]
MKFVLAPDSFKGGRSAIEVATAMKTGLSKVFPDAEYDLVPMADGGEGTVQSLVDATHGEIINVSVTGPLGNQVIARYGMLGDGTTAAIEMAQASGIQYVDDTTHNPMITTTYGTGEMILDALDHGAKEIILGIGGSATNDGGAGMAQAIGVHLRDIEGNELEYGGGQLDKLATIDTREIDPRIPKTKILIASDVTNPLVGETGSSAVFGPQKGATPEMVKILDANLAHYAAVIKHELNKDLAEAPGAGAAGGLGAGLMAFTNSQMEKGVDIVIEYTHLKERAKDADFVFTGEGGIDSQTQYGKTPFGVALATKSVAPKAPVIVLSGNIGDGLNVLYRPDAIDAIFPTATAAKSLEKAIADAASDIEMVSENIGRLIAAMQRK